MEKISYVIDPDNEYPKNYSGHVRAELIDGRIIEERQGQMRGGTKEPLSRDEILIKARANLTFAGRAAGAAETLDQFARRLFKSSDVFSAQLLGQLGE